MCQENVAQDTSPPTDHINCLTKTHILDVGHVISTRHIHVHVCVSRMCHETQALQLNKSNVEKSTCKYGVATISTLLKITGLFRKKAL